MRELGLNFARRTAARDGGKMREIGHGGLARLVALGLVSAAFTLGCDIGSENELPDLGEIESRDPYAVGSDIDVGSGDLGVPTPVQKYGRLSVNGTQLVDAAGNPVQLKGVSSMWLNWENDGYAESADALRWMRNNWNLTLIRAAMGVEPAGAYLADPEHALGQVQRIIDNAIAAGVYVLVDWHAHRAHTHTADAVAFFSQISAKYKGVPNVLYETFNEPEDIPWSTVLKPYHEAVVAAIRANDPDAIIVLGTRMWSQGVGEAAQDPLEGRNLMYTLHFYACDHNFRSQADSALMRGLPIFVTEWGATTADGGTENKPVCLEKAQTWIDWMRARQISWAAWKLDNCPSDTSCLLAQDAPIDGGWTQRYLYGHGPFVRGRIQEGP